ELLCLPTAGWFHAKCRLTRHFVGLSAGRWWPSLGSQALSAPGRLRLLACSPQGHVLTCDDAGTLRLCWASDGEKELAPGAEAQGSTLRELAALSMEELTQQVLALTRAHLASYTVTDMFCTLGIDGHLRLDLATSAGDRLHFSLSSSSSAEASCSSRASSSRYGFCLQHVASSWAAAARGGCASAAAARAVGNRSTCLEEHHAPCGFAPGGDGSGSLKGGAVWLRVALRPGSAATELAVSVRVDRPPPGMTGAGEQVALELQGLLSFDSPVLDISEEQSMSSWGQQLPGPFGAGLAPAPPNSRSFVLLLADRIQVVTLCHQAPLASRAPGSSKECCSYLMSLAASSARSAAGTRPRFDWMWSLDDARFPSFEEQQRHLLLKHGVPAMQLGRWFSGLLSFLGVTLRPVWGSQLLVAPVTAVAGGAPALLGGLPCGKRRRCAGPVTLALREGLVRHILSRLAPVIQFVREGLPAAEATPKDGEQSAASRAQLFTQAQPEASAAARSERLLRQVLDLLVRLQQVLGLVAVLHKRSCVRTVLDSPLLLEPVPRRAAEGLPASPSSGEASALSLLSERTLRELVASPEALGPVVQLCTALVLHSGSFASIQTSEAGHRTSLEASGAASNEVCQELQESCPSIFSQVDLSCCTARSSQERRSAEAASESSQMGDIFRRYARCAPAAGASLEDHWAVLMKGVRAVASEDPLGAAEICIEKILQLQPNDSVSAGRARSLLEAFLDALCPEPSSALAVARVVEGVLARTRAWQSGEQCADGQPFLHNVAIDYMLSSPRLHAVMEKLLNTAVVDMEAMLLKRHATSRAAAECLWKYYRQHGQTEHAASLLLQLAERPDSDMRLRETR
ncbi:unnamed protein product, partial [Polarella glacialis]